MKSKAQAAGKVWPLEVGKEHEHVAEFPFHIRASLAVSHSPPASLFQRPTDLENGVINCHYGYPVAMLSDALADKI